MYVAGPATYPTCRQVICGDPALYAIAGDPALSSICRGLLLSSTSFIFPKTTHYQYAIRLRRCYSVAWKCRRKASRTLAARSPSS